MYGEFSIKSYGPSAITLNIWMLMVLSASPDSHYCYTLCRANILGYITGNNVKASHDCLGTRIRFFCLIPSIFTPHKGLYTWRINTTTLRCFSTLCKIYSWTFREIFIQSLRRHRTLAFGPEGGGYSAGKQIPPLGRFRGTPTLNGTK